MIFGDAHFRLQRGVSERNVADTKGKRQFDREVSNRRRDLVYEVCSSCSLTKANFSGDPGGGDTKGAVQIDADT